VQERLAAGEQPEAAHAGALKEFGNVTLTHEAVRHVWRGALGDWLVDFCQDIRYTGRSLRRNPGYVVVVTMVLALGVGASAAVFSLFNAAFLIPLPGVDDPGRLAVVLGRTTDGRIVTVSYPDYQDIRDRSASFSALAAASPTPFSLGLGANAERVWGEFVSGNYFSALQVTAQLGRTLSPSDEDPSADAVAVISEGLWRRAFNADSGVVGATVLISSQPVTIVGVAEPGFRGSMVSVVYDLFLPLTLQPRFGGESMLEARGSRWLLLTGRLAHGVAIDTAAAEMKVLGDHISAMDPRPDLRERVAAFPLWRSPFGAQSFLRPIVAALGVASVLVLVIACTNLATLVLARAVTRRREIALRLALGANRIRIVRLLLLENLLLAVPAAVLGLAVATRDFGGGSRSTATVAPAQLDPSLDVWVIGFGLLVACLSAVLCGFLPALRASRVSIASILKEAGTGQPARSPLRAALVVVQVAASFVLLTGAGLTHRAVQAARSADIGFDPSDTVSVSMDLEPGGYDRARGLVFYARLLEQLRTAAGVNDAAAAAFVPLRMIEGSSRLVATDGYVPRTDEDMSFAHNTVSPEYFRTLRIEVIEGREFDGGDRADTQQVVIVNETIARRFWQTPQNAIGKRLRVGIGDDKWRTVVGVVRDIKYLTLNEPPTPYFYLPLAQDYRSEMTVHVRGTVGTQPLIDLVRNEVRGLDQHLPVYDTHTLTEQARVGVMLYETVATVLAAFGMMALGLAAVGIYGLVSYTVKQRAHEIGIRVALGASQADVVRRFLWTGLQLGTVGAGIGLIVFLGVSRLMVPLLYGVEASDPVAFSAAFAIVLALTLLASVIPAWRAARTEPLSVLHHP
jgi:predicted permease